MRNHKKARQESGYPIYPRVNKQNVELLNTYRL